MKSRSQKQENVSLDHTKKIFMKSTPQNNENINLRSQKQEHYWVEITKFGNH